MNYCYILQCKDKSFYTGWTTDIKRRFEAHCSGNGAKYTRGRGPLKLVYVEEFDTKEHAMQREYAIKQMSRCNKEKLIAEWAKNHGGFVDIYLKNRV